MIISNELYESIVPGWEALVEAYNAKVAALPRPRTQQMLNDAHADFVIQRDAYFSSFGVTDDDFIETIEARL
jgi:hypothetical protein